MVRHQFQSSTTATLGRFLSNTMSNKVIYGALSRVFSIVLIVVGAAVIFGGTYAHGFVREQLVQEKITMPTQEGIDKLKDQESKEILTKWIGQDLTTGPQAKAYADNYIWQHMLASADGKTFQEMGTVINEAKKKGASEEEIAKLQKIRDSLFQGDTLRGILLSAYGWWFVGSIAMWAGIGMAILGVILAILGFGVMRTKRA